MKFRVNDVRMCCSQAQGCFHHFLEDVCLKNIRSTYMRLISGFWEQHESDVGYDQDGTFESGMSDVELVCRVTRTVRMVRKSQSLKEPEVSLTAVS